MVVVSGVARKTLSDSSTIIREGGRDWDWDWDWEGGNGYRRGKGTDLRRDCTAATELN